MMSPAGPQTQEDRREGRNAAALNRYIEISGGLMHLLVQIMCRRGATTKQTGENEVALRGNAFRSRGAFSRLRNNK